MAKCRRCGKSGLFLKTDKDGLCESCATEVYAEKVRAMDAEKKKNALNRIASIPMHEICTSEETRKRQHGYDPVNFSNITPKGDFSRFVVIDTETTGLAPSRDRIIDIAAIRFIDGLPVERFNSFVNPERAIPQEASDINGITDSDVCSAPTISQILPSFEKFISNDILVGHNIDFDLKFLFHSGSTLFDTKRKYIDTLQQSRKILKKPKSSYSDSDFMYGYDSINEYYYDGYSLDELCSFFDIIRAESHRATDDALATGDLFLELVEIKQD